MLLCMCTAHVHAGGAVQEDVAVGQEAHALRPAADLLHALLAYRVEQAARYSRRIGTICMNSR
jgi:hypothetical protein